MNVAICHKYLRLHRGPIAILVLVFSNLLGIVFLSLAFLVLCDIFETSRWDQAPRTGGSACLYSWLGLGLILFSASLYSYVRPIITFTASLAFALQANRRGQFDEADRHAREAWKYGVQLPPDDPCRTSALAILVETARSLGDYDDAESFGRQWIEVEERIWGSAHPRTIHAILNVASIFMDIARFSHAKPLLEKALPVLEANANSDSFALARCQGMFAEVWSALQRDELAEPAYRRAYEALQHSRKQSSPTGLNIIIGFANLLARNGQFDEAESNIKTAYDLSRRRFAPESWQIACCLDSLARLRFFQERYIEAEGLSRRALAIAEKVFPSDHPWLTVMWQGLAITLAAQEKWAEAEEYFRKALRVGEEFCAPEHPRIADLLEDYADLLEKTHRFEEAQTHHNHAQQIRDFHALFRII